MWQAKLLLQDLREPRRLFLTCNPTAFVQPVVCLPAMFGVKEEEDCERDIKHSDTMAHAVGGIRFIAATGAVCFVCRALNSQGASLAEGFAL